MSSSPGQPLDRPEIDLAELRRLADAQSPDLADMIIELLKQPDPKPDKPLPPGWVHPHTLRRQSSRAAWDAFLAQDPPPPPRWFIADLVEKLYLDGSEYGRATIVELANKSDNVPGLWGGLKRVYKLSEA